MKTEEQELQALERKMQDEREAIAEARIREAIENESRNER
jgi:hypothetical protein